MPGHVSGKLRYYRVFAVNGYRTVIDPCLTPFLHNVPGDNRFKNIILLKETVQFKKNPFPAKKIAAGSLFHMNEAFNIDSQDALIFKMFAHKTLLLSGYKIHSIRVGQEENTLAVM